MQGAAITNFSFNASLCSSSSRPEIRHHRDPPFAGGACAAFAPGGRKAWQCRQLEKTTGRLLARTGSDHLIQQGLYRTGVNLPTLAAGLSTSVASRSASDNSLPGLPRGQAYLGAGNPGVDCTTAGLRDFLANHGKSAQPVEVYLQSLKSQTLDEEDDSSSSHEHLRELHKGGVAKRKQRDTKVWTQPIDVESKDTSIPPWPKELDVARQHLQDFDSGKLKSGPARREGFKVKADLYEYLCEQNPPQGPVALATALAFVFGSVSAAFRRIDINKNGELSLIEFVMGMEMIGLDVETLCGMDLRHLFRALDTNHNGAINLKEMIRLAGDLTGPGALLQSLKSKKNEMMLSRSSALLASGRDGSFGNFRKLPAKEASMQYSHAICGSGADSSHAHLDDSHISASLAKWIAVSKVVSLLAKVVDGSSSLPLTPSASGIDQDEIKLQASSKKSWQRGGSHCVDDLLIVGKKADYAQDYVGDGSFDKQTQHSTTSCADLTAASALTTLDDGRRLLQAAVEVEGSTLASTGRMKTCEDLLQEAFNANASIFSADGTHLMNRPGLTAFFADLLVADPKWYRRLDSQVLDAIYDEVIALQIDFTHVGRGLSYWSFKVVLTHMLKELGQGWMSVLRTRISERTNPRKFAPADSKRKAFCNQAQPVPVQYNQRRREALSQSPLCLHKI